MQCSTLWYAMLCYVKGRVHVPLALTAIHHAAGLHACASLLHLAITGWVDWWGQHVALLALCLCVGEGGVFHTHTHITLQSHVLKGRRL